MVSNRAAKIPRLLTDDLNSLIIHSKQVWRRVIKRSAVEDNVAFHSHFLSCLPYPLIGIKVSQTLFTFFLCSQASLSSPSPEVSFVPLLHFLIARQQRSLLCLGRGEVRMGKIGGVQIVLSPKMQPISRVSIILSLTVPINKSWQEWLNQIFGYCKMRVNSSLPTFLFSDSEYCKRTAEMVCPTCSHKRICSLLSR